jgi:hypothetical protein
MRALDDIATKFQASIPDERFRKFLRVLQTTALRKGRLLAWQDFLWAKFRETCPEAPASFVEIAEALRMCPVHLSRMSMAEVPIQYGLWHFSQQELKAKDDLFPFANYVVHGPDWGGAAKTALVPVCSECREARDLWDRTHTKAFGNPVPLHREGWQGEYFEVADVFDVPQGLALTGLASNLEVPWVKVGHRVALIWPTGQTEEATVLAIDTSIMNSCFSDGSAQRCILIASTAVKQRPVPGTRVRAVARI